MAFTDDKQLHGGAAPLIAVVVCWHNSSCAKVIHVQSSHARKARPTSQSNGESGDRESRDGTTSDLRVFLLDLLIALPAIQLHTGLQIERSRVPVDVILSVLDTVREALLDFGFGGRVMTQMADGQAPYDCAVPEIRRGSKQVTILLCHWYRYPMLLSRRGVEKS